MNDGLVFEGDSAPALATVLSWDGHNGSYAAADIAVAPSVQQFETAFAGIGRFSAANLSIGT
jgi:hypothetical protein